jgi:hypothetical protein
VRAPRRSARPGLHRLPRELRDAGVPVRQYDVFRPPAHRRGHTDIARRPLISPKTVEKHVSSLMAKLPDRVTLFDHAAGIGGELFPSRQGFPFLGRSHPGAGFDAHWSDPGRSTKGAAA